jgi:hypothetical protein
MSAIPSKPPRKPMVIVVPEEFVHDMPGGDREVSPGVWFCRIGRTEYHSSISRAAVERGPTWTPASPLPLSHERAVETARRTLGRFVRSLSNWHLAEITLQRLRHADPERWFFVVGFSLETGRVSEQGVMQICVDFTGRPGSITKAKMKSS